MTINVYNQKELNAVADDFAGEIHIFFGDPINQAYVYRRFPNALLVARDISYVSVCNLFGDRWNDESAIEIEARDSSTVEAEGYVRIVGRDSSEIFARKDTYVIAKGHSDVDVQSGGVEVEAWEESHVVAWAESWDNPQPRIEAHDNASVEAGGETWVKAWENAHITAQLSAWVGAYDNAFVEARDYSYVEAHGNAKVKAKDNAEVDAFGNCSVEARGSASVRAWDNARVKTWDSASVETKSGKPQWVFAP